MPRAAKVHELYYGGYRMSAPRDYWSGQGHSYWPAATLDANTQGLEYIDCRYGDGRDFSPERIFDPKENGDNSLLHYLAENAPDSVSGDTFNLLVIPKGYSVSSMALDLASKQAATAVTVELVPVAGGAAIATTTVASGTASASTVVPVDNVVTDGLYVVRLVLGTAVAEGTLDWSNFNFTVSVNAKDVSNRYPVINIPVM